MTTLRLAADDLTGALDAGASFTGLISPLPCSLDPVVAWPTGESLLINLGCRDGTESAAVAVTRATLPLLRGATIAFKKIDSLLRGHWAAELAACMQSGMFASIVLAPAFPAQNRATRSGRQWVRSLGQDWSLVSVGPAEALAARGIASEILAIGVGSVPAQTGAVVICDADTEADLEQACLRLRDLPKPILWCGSAGLARALAGKPPRAATLQERPHLAIIGTNNPVSLSQIACLQAAAADRIVTFDHDASESVKNITAVLGRHGSALALPDVPARLAEGDVAEHIARLLGAVFSRLAGPASLTASGGETFLALCRALQVEHLQLIGELAPGLPVSRLVGGVWNSTTALSKSGAFDTDDIYRRLLIDGAL